MMKKKNIIILLFIFLLIPINTSAKTLKEFKNELQAAQEALDNNQSEIQATQEEIDAAQARVEEIYTEMSDIDNEMIEINKKIAQLNEKILDKDNEIKDLMKYYQFSNGESAYLEYLFKASSITDFIYRVSITEQLSKYNDELIKEMNSMIEENNQNIQSLQEKEKDLKVLQKELGEKLVILGSQMDSLADDSVALKDELAAAQATVEQYEKLGCEDDDDVSNCAKNQLPAGTRFWRPMNLGYLTAPYGYSSVYGSTWHTGMDMSTYKSDAGNIYAISDGRVAFAAYNGTMGNVVMIHHNINGNNYSSIYMHLSAIYVSSGDFVSKDTIVGSMGETGAAYGAHLHLSLITCLIYDGDCFNYRNYTVNPNDYINFPSSLYYDWEDRTTYYE
jgi:murein DD-endopeptidase MepM/ murein hydrolase activator NlpD